MGKTKTKQEFRWYFAVVKAAGGGLPYCSKLGDTIYVRKRNDTKGTGRTVIAMYVAATETPGTEIVNVSYTKPDICRRALELSEVVADQDFPISRYAAYCRESMIREAKEKKLRGIAK